MQCYFCYQTITLKAEEKIQKACEWCEAQKV